eukprot:SAG22_NODE_1511_length_4257_cov_10.774651_1_plen_95_part_10
MLTAPTNSRSDKAPETAKLAPAAIVTAPLTLNDESDAVAISRTSCCGPTLTAETVYGAAAAIGRYHHRSTCFDIEAPFRPILHQGQGCEPQIAII